MTTKQAGIMKKLRTLADIRKDPRVQWVSDERGSDEGIWVYLTNDYFNEFLDSGKIHEEKVSECLEQMNRDVRERTPLDNF